MLICPVVSASLWCLNRALFTSVSSSLRALVSSVLPTVWNRRDSGRSRARPCGGSAFPCSGCGITQRSDYQGFVLQRVEGDRDEPPLDFRFIDPLLRSADDPGRNLGTFAQGVKVGRDADAATTGRRGGGHSQNTATLRTIF